MRARLRSRWQKIRKHWIVAIIIALVITAIMLILVESLINGTGFNGYNQVTTAHTISGSSAGTVVRTEVSQPGKTLWDWLQLLIIPLALAIIEILFNRAERKNEQTIASDNQQEAALQGYINEMSELLLEKLLRKSKEGDEVRTIARWSEPILPVLAHFR
jgi:large-conductance mechanosensitive channel